jgi:hypothetical protein
MFVHFLRLVGGQQSIIITMSYYQEFIAQFLEEMILVG